MRSTLMFGGMSDTGVSVPTNTVFASDAFTNSSGTSLQTHGWTKHASYGAGDMQISDANRAKFNGGAITMLYYYPADPTNADYDVSGDLVFFTDISVQFGVAGRIQTGAATFYVFVGVAGATDEWRLRKCNAGTFTTLDSAAVSWSASTYAVKLEMRGTTLKGYVNGVETCSATDSDITLAGKAGLFAFGTSLNSAGIHFDNFEARNA